MLRCLQLAEKGLGNVAPNPMVGAVVVHQNKIIGEGFHEMYGGPHAEVNAINAVTDQSLLASSTLYVSLEPCNHLGKTPPCCDLILKHRIPTVIICNSDPNPQVNSSGINRLKEAGIKVETGILEEKGAFLNRRFFTYHQKKRPYIILKWAQTKDGFIDRIRSDKDAKVNWISTKDSIQLKHQWRTEEQAILIGKNTAINDNPQLTSRLYKGKNPLRILIDNNLNVSLDHQIFNKEATTLVFNSIKEEKKETIHFHLIHDFSLPALLSYLHSISIQSVIVEGGAQTLQGFIDEGLWDEARVFTSEMIWKEGLPAPRLKAEFATISTATGDELKTYFHK